MSKSQTWPGTGQQLAHEAEYYCLGTVFGCLQCLDKQEATVIHLDPGDQPRLLVTLQGVCKSSTLVTLVVRRPIDMGDAEMMPTPCSFK